MMAMANNFISLRVGGLAPKQGWAQEGAACGWKWAAAARASPLCSVRPLVAAAFAPFEFNGERGYTYCIRCGFKVFCFQTLYWNPLNRAVLSFIYVFYYAYIQGLVIKCSCQEASCIWKMLWLFYLNSRVRVGFQNLIGCLGVFK